MSLSSALKIVLVALCSACAATNKGSLDNAAPSSEQLAVSRVPASEIPLAGSAAFTTEPRILRVVSSASDELSLWKEPKFQRQLAESYLAESDVEPRLTADERKSMQQALELIGNEKLDDAVKLLEKARNPASSAVFEFTLANIYFQREELPPAAALYQAAVDKYPKFRRAWRNLGLIRVRQGEFPQALPALTRVIELGGSDAVTFGLLGFAYSNVENHLAAESAYRMAILLDPATRDWKMGLARSFFKQQRFADAVSLCDNLLSAEPNRADLWLLQANAYVGQGKPLQAAQNFEMVERLGGATADSLNMLADIYINEELFDLAVDCYVRGMEKAPEASPERALRAAKVLTARGALVQTRQLIERIQGLHGDKLGVAERKDLLKLRARLAVALGAGDEEAKVLEEIVAIDPLDGEALILLGQHSGRKGDNEQAIFYFQRAAGIEASEADAKVRHAQLLVGQGKYGEALPLLRRAQALKPRENIQQYLEQVERVAQTR